MFLTRPLWALTAGVRGALVALITLGLTITALGIASLALAGYAIGAVFRGEGWDGVWPFVAAAAGVAVTRGLLLFAKEALGSHVAVQVKSGLRARIYEHLQTLGPGFLDRKRTGELVATAVDSVEALETYYARYLPQMAVTALAPVGIFVYLWTLHPAFAVAMAVSLVLALVVPNGFKALTGKYGGAYWASYGSFWAMIVDSLQGLPTLKAFARAKDRGREITEGADAIARHMAKVFAVNFGVAGLMDLIVTGGATAALVAGTILTVTGELAPGTLVVLLLLSNAAFQPLRDLAGLFHFGQQGVNAAAGIFALLAETPDVRDDAVAAPARIDPTVVFEDVVFAYDGGARPALNGVSFTAPGGRTTALVGPSGAGKSTVVSLLLRFADPQSGRITLGGHDLRTLPLDALRALCAYVGQDTYLFHGTVAENLRIARPDATDAEIVAAATAANAHGFIAALPDGYDTVIGERGARLSGGQRQRVAIARALLKDAPILLLDEPTSSVDAENEEIIQEALRRLTVGRTTIVIAHRLSTIVDADQIVVLADGHVVERGTHAELVAADGVYLRLIAAQRSDTESDPDARRLLASAGGAA